MNANELVERTVELLDEARECFQAANPYLTDEESKLFKKDYEYYDALLYALSATIPRETAVQKPTEADCEKSCKDVLCLLAFDSQNKYWGMRSIETVRGNPKIYPYWIPMLPMPEIPEVEK